MVDLEALVDGPLDLHREALHRRRLDRVLNLSIGAEQATSVDAQSLVRAH